MNTSKRLFYGYWIVLSGFIVLTVSNGLGFYGFSVLNKPVGDEFGWSRSAVTAAFSAFIIGAAVFSPLVGRFTDKRGPSKTFFLGIVVMSLSFFLLSRTTAVWNYCLLHFLLGIGLVLLGPIPVSVIITSWFYRFRGTMQGLAFTGIGVGGLIFAPLIGNYFIPNFGWRTTYLFMAVLVLGAMMPLECFVVRDLPEQKGLSPYGFGEPGITNSKGSELESLTGLSLRNAMREKTFWIIGLTSAIYGMCINAGLQNQVSILTEHNFRVADAVMAIGFVGLSSAIGKFLFGLLCDWINSKYASSLAYALVALSLFTMIQASTRLHLWVYAALMGLGQGGWAPNMAMLSVGYFGLKHYGAVLGAVHLTFMLGESLGPILAGLAYDQTGNYHFVLFLMGCSGIACAALIAIIKKPLLVKERA